MRRAILLATLLVLAVAAPASARPNTTPPPACFTGQVTLGNVSTVDQAFMSSRKGGDCLHQDEAIIPREWTLSAGFYFGSGWCATVSRVEDGWHQTYRGPGWFLFAQGDSRNYNAALSRC